MDTHNTRPFGVALIAALYLAIAVISLIIAASYVLNPAGNENMIMLFTRLKIPVTFLNLLAVPPLITAGLATLLFRGLWEARAWSRVATLFLSFLAMLASLATMAFIQVFNIGSPLATWIATGAFAAVTLIFIYLLKTDWTDPSQKPHQAEQYNPEESIVPVIEPHTLPPAPPAPPPPVPPALLEPKEMYDKFHSAPTMVAGEIALKGDATVRLEPEEKPTTQPTACLIATSGRDQGRHFEITSADILIGRHPTLADFVLNDPTISAQHARIRYEDGHYVLHDLDSTNGTFVNKQRITIQPLQDQDRIKLGVVEMIFTTPCQD